MLIKAASKWSKINFEFNKRMLVLHLMFWAQRWFLFVEIAGLVFQWKHRQLGLESGTKNIVSKVNTKINTYTIAVKSRQAI